MADLAVLDDRAGRGGPADNIAVAQPPSFDALRAQSLALWEQLKANSKPRVILGMGTCGIAAGANHVEAAVREGLAAHGVDASIEAVGCIGTCYAEPLLDVVMPGQPRVSYGYVTPDVARKIVDGHVVGGRPLADLAMAVFGEESVDG